MSRLPETGPSLTRWLRQQERNAQRQANSSSFNLSGVSVSAEGEMTVDGTLNVTGNLAVSGNAAITGTLSLPAGIIYNDALASPVLPAAVNLTTTAFAPTSTWAEVVGLDLTVPTDATRLLATASAWVYAVNNTAAADDLHARVSLAAVDGQAFLTPLPMAGYNTISAGLATLAEYLTPGSTLRLLASAKTTTGTFTTDLANTATLTASLTWLR